MKRHIKRWLCVSRILVAIHFVEIFELVVIHFLLTFQEFYRYKYVVNNWRVYTIYMYACLKILLKNIN